MYFPLISPILCFLFEHAFLHLLKVPSTDFTHYDQFSTNQPVKAEAETVWDDVFCH